MQLFAAHDILNAIWAGAVVFWELKGVFSEAAVSLVLLPLHEFSVAAAFIAAVWVRILWRNKGVLVSGVSHMLHIAESLAQVIKLGSRIRR